MYNKEQKGDVHNMIVSASAVEQSPCACNSNMFKSGSWQICSLLFNVLLLPPRWMADHSLKAGLVPTYSNFAKSLPLTVQVMPRTNMKCLCRSLAHWRASLAAVTKMEREETPSFSAGGSEDGRVMGRKDSSTGKLMHLDHAV